MKALLNKFFIFHFLVAILLSCSSLPKEYLKNDNSHCYNDPIFKITKDEMTFDVEKYKDSLKKGNFILVDNEKFKSRFLILPSKNIMNKQLNKKINIGKWLDYYPNGKIKHSNFIYLNGDTEIGKETEYDQQGNIVKVIDYEKGYKICWVEAIEIVKQIAKKDIKKYEIIGYNLSHNNLNEFPNVNPEWHISLDGNEEYEEKDTKIYVIDGVTGKLNRTYRIRMIY